MSVALETLQAALPPGGLHPSRWRLSPEPLRLAAAEVRALQRLGHPLARFQHACDEIYRRSAGQSLPAWLAELLDTGKPTWMVEVQREAGRQGQRPRVIRPDLLLGEEGLSLTELDAVPGGMGITAWLSQVYGAEGYEVLGGAEGMLTGFGKVLPAGGVVVVAEEAADYRLEMDWLVETLGGGRRLEMDGDFAGGAEAVYRFFEWFDWESSGWFRSLAEGSVSGEVRLSPPCLPHLEDKLWLALLWTPALESLWPEMMRGSHLKRLRELVPFGWVVDPTPLPPHAALPRLDVHSWDQVAAFSQSQRRLVLKISGFHETAWGSRGVHIGHDLPGTEWRDRLRHALAEYGQQPWLMQEYRETRVVQHPVYRSDGSVEMMDARVRLCPYYFTDDGGRTELGGCLATLAPADKKKIHGMRDAVLVPVVPE
jgi:hypothetical protein